MSFYIIVLLFSGLLGLASTQCRFNLHQHEGKTPIALTLSGDLLNSGNSNGDIVLQQGQTIQLLCSGPGNHLLNAKIKKTANVTCETNKFRLITDNNLYNFADLKCRRNPLPTTEEFGVCHGHSKRIKIGFDAVTHFIPLIDLCFDPKKLITYWTTHKLKTSTYTCSVSAATSFKKDYYPNNTDQIYSHNGIYQIGHLSPRCDFFTGPEKRMTFYYINSSPQIKEFNNGNWRALEAEIRAAAKNSGKYLMIYTGTAKSVQSLTGGSVTIPVQRYFWKIVTDIKNTKGVAFVGINDIKLMHGCPCQQEVNCTQITWVNLRSSQQKAKGLIYCCTVQSLLSNSDFVTPLLSFTGGLLTQL